MRRYYGLIFLFSFACVLYPAPVFPEAFIESRLGCVSSLDSILSELLPTTTDNYGNRQIVLDYADAKDELSGECRILFSDFNNNTMALRMIWADSEFNAMSIYANSEPIMNAVCQVSFLYYNVISTPALFKQWSKAQYIEYKHLQYQALPVVFEGQSLYGLHPESSIGSDLNKLSDIESLNCTP